MPTKESDGGLLAAWRVYGLHCWVQFHRPAALPKGPIREAASTGTNRSLAPHVHHDPEHTRNDPAVNTGGRLRLRRSAAQVRQIELAASGALNACGSSNASSNANGRDRTGANHLKHSSAGHPNHRTTSDGSDTDRARLLIRGSGTDRAANRAAKRLNADGHWRTVSYPAASGPGLPPRSRCQLVNGRSANRD
jgi:hypothetical protein